jgi:hypothetical protein
MLNEIDVAVRNDETPRPITVILTKDSNGQPGAALETWNVTDIVPPPSGFVALGPSTAVTVLDTLDVT